MDAKREISHLLKGKNCILLYTLVGRKNLNGLKEVFCMWSKNCKCGKRRALCPVSLGIAVGLVMGLAYLIAPQFTQVAMPTSADWYQALMEFLKGLGIGFFIALFYDLISCCCKMGCCRSGSCDCSCCNKDARPPEVK